MSCTDIDPHTWAEQTLQNAFAAEGPGNGIDLANGRPLPDGLFCGSCMYAGIGAQDGARVVLTEMGDNSPIAPNWKAEQAMESLLSLLEKYRIDGGSYYQWVDFPSKTFVGSALTLMPVFRRTHVSAFNICMSTPTDPDAVKRRGLGFVYNPVEKEILDMGGFHLIAIPNASFEGDADGQGMPSHWTITGSGTGTAYFLAQETGQPEVPSRGNYALRLIAGSDSRAAVSAVSEPIPVTAGTNYTSVANLRFAWNGDSNSSAAPSERPQVFFPVHYLNASGAPASNPSDIFRYFQEDSTQGFRTFVAQYTPPADARFVQIEIGAAQNGLTTPIVLDADNLR